MKHGRSVSVIGLGYVGLPVAVAFGRHARVVGFDINTRRIEELRRGHDHTGEVETTDLKAADILFTSDPEALRHADFHIVAVPTPVDNAHQPDLSPVTGATSTLAPRLKRGDIVVYESTVYPGVTEDICAPILEELSGLRSGRDFFLGYSPERINPGDKTHTFTKITKVVSGQTLETLNTVAAVYESVVEAGVYRAPSIRAAEAAKVFENTQRDLNIALVNELAMLCHRMGIDTQDVLAAARTKWNFLSFVPGLVGGHCIGVDPYYLTHRAEQLGYHPQVILAGRRINDSMGRYLAHEVVKELIRGGATVQGAVVTILGFTFKEDVPDLRNTRVIDVVRELEEFGVRVQVHDPVADGDEAHQETGVQLRALAELVPADAVVLAVAHRPFREQGWSLIQRVLRGGQGVVADVKGMLDRHTAPNGCRIWRL